MSGGPVTSAPEFRVLGPLQVRAGGRAVAIGGPKERALLALLLVNPNRVLSVDRLTEELWGDAAPDRATAALRVYVSHLRRALGAEGEEVIATRPPGYLLRLEPAQLDATLFETIAAEGHAHLRERRADLAAVRLRDALALWRGPALADVAALECVRPEVARLEELRLGAVEGRVEADLECGRHGELVGELRSLVDENPLRERLWTALMLALHRSGRRPEALAAYQQVRRILGAEVGLDPGPQLIALERAVLANDRSLDWASAARTVELRGRSADSEPGEPGRLSLPPAVVALSDSVFVGRRFELGHLESAWGRARDGTSQVVLLAGEPGMGKTALAVRLAAQAWSEGATVLFGRCDEESLVPFQPFVEALSHHAEGTPAGHLRRVLGDQAPDLALLLPGLRRILPELGDVAATGADTERYRLFEAVPSLLRAMASEAPVVLLLDDLHWADKPTLQLLQHVIRRASGVPLLVLGAYRDTDLVRTHPMADTLAELRRANLVDRVMLRGLGRDDVAELVTPGGAAGAAGEELVDAVWRQTDGHPLFLREILRHLAETGAITAREGGGWEPRRRVEQLGIPEGVKEVIGRRLTRLSEVANVALRTGSVMGRSFRLDVLEAVCDQPADALLDALEEAAAAGVVDEVPGALGRWSFTHALLHDALYDELSLTRRVRMHQRVAEALELLVAADPGPHLAELAHHFGQAAVAVGPERAIDYAVRAGERAILLSAYEEAVRLFGMALEVAEDAGVDRGARADLLLAIGRAQWRFADARVPRATFERVVAMVGTSDPERLALAALGHAGAGMHFFWVDLVFVNDRAIELLESALAALPETDSGSRARVMACLAQALYFVPGTDRRRDELSAAGLAMARRVGDPRILAEVLNSRSLSVYGPDRPAEHAAYAHEMLAIAGRLADPDLAVFAHARACVAASDAGDCTALTRELDEMDRLAAAHNHPMLHEYAAYIRANQWILEGRLDEAEALMYEGLRCGREAGDVAALPLFMGVLICLRIFQGRASEVVHVASLAPSVMPITTSVSHMFGAASWAIAGHHVEARRQLEGVDPTAVPRLLWWKYVLALYGIACARLRDAGRAAITYDLLTPYAGSLLGGSGSVGYGPATWILGLCAATAGRHEVAEDHFAHALAVGRENGWPAVVAQVEAGHAAMLAERNAGDDHVRARRMAESALSIARELDMRDVAAEARRILRRIDGRAPAMAPAESRGPRRGRLRSALLHQGRSAVVRLTRQQSDEALTRRFGSPVAQRALFSAMALAFRQATDTGFSGSLLFELLPAQDGVAPVASDWWTLELRGGHASARRGRVEAPTVALRLRIADLLRLVSGELNPVLALIERRLDYDGDVLALLRLAETFGEVEVPEIPGEPAEVDAVGTPR